MPETIVTRILRLPGYGVYAWDAEATTGTLTLWVRQTARVPYYVCGGCGISVRDVHSWTERRVRDLPWGTWRIWLVLEIHRVRCRRCGVRTERLAFVEGKAHATTRLAATVAQACEAAPVTRVAAHRAPDRIRLPRLALHLETTMARRQPPRRRSATPQHLAAGPSANASKGLIGGPISDDRRAGSSGASTLMRGSQSSSCTG